MIEAESATCSQCGAVFTPQSALSDINPDEVKAAVETLKTAIGDATTGVVTPLNNAEPLIVDAMVIRQKDLSGNLAEIKSNIEELGKSLIAAIDAKDYYSEAVNYYNQCQSKYNQAAKSAAAACAAADIAAAEAAAAGTTEG